MEKINLWTLIIVIAVAILIGGYYFIDFFMRTNDSVGEINQKNSKLIEPGMNKEQMIEIMGQPDTIYDWTVFNVPKKSMIYSYENVPLSSDMIHIVVDSTSHVINVFSAN